MRALHKKRRIQVIVITLASMTLATILMGYAFKDGINLYYSPIQVMEEPPSEGKIFRLGGLVVDNSIVAGQGVQFHFDVTDGGHTVRVNYIGKDLRPDLFAEGQGTIAKGYFKDNVFWASELLAKHDETYMPKEVLEALKEQGVYQSPDE